ncbi:aminoglycoside 6-adenylyltransferase [Salipaludibacillus sp. CUR1]|uniref:aminoglycoside 6-adenylyltransferase n=1 Tax=Salipaludibacillus sp. CUR1 TaxID=2820003 RepID=UPI001E4C6997|nr:aminoglycoside 6-adenylyltransferase [Salipaludibacillus sp. CUR1]MCE7794474.1 aminoglycoside 6-adenylyltransferase [Salipaludibacillus sp. CUR1]
MRTEKEMYHLILRTAEEDDRIRAVYMNGSRTNPAAPSDIFQDYDIVYVVKETDSFIQNKKWLNVFGDLLMLQEPDRNDLLTGLQRNVDRSYGYLMLFKDGNRIDLQLQTLEVMREEYAKDKLTVPLLDKDNCLPSIPSPSDRDYHVKIPDEAHFNSCANNFWWCLQNVAKGIWRDELPYAKNMFENVIRPCLDGMVSWWIGITNGFNISTGKMGKYFKNYLPAAYWNRYIATYSDGNYERFWTSIFEACGLFRLLAQDVADHFEYTYPSADDRHMTAYLKQVRNLPEDSQQIF